MQYDALPWDWVGWAGDGDGDGAGDGGGGGDGDGGGGGDGDGDGDDVMRCDAMPCHAMRMGWDFVGAELSCNSRPRKDGMGREAGWI